MPVSLSGKRRIKTFPQLVKAYNLYKKKRLAKYRKGPGRVLMARSLNIGRGLYYFKANVFSNTTFTGNPADPGWSVSNVYSLTPSTVPTMIDCSNLFDQYKIKKIWCTMTYKQGNTDDIDDVVSSGDEFPTVYWIQDKDDNNAITSAQLQEHSIMRKFQFGNGAKTTFKFAIPPYVKNGIASITSSSLVAEQVKKSPWIDFANMSIAHGCTKMLIRAGNLTSADVNYKFDLDYHVIFETRTVR